MIELQMLRTEAPKFTSLLYSSGIAVKDTENTACLCSKVSFLRVSFLGVSFLGVRELMKASQYHTWA